MSFYDLAERRKSVRSYSDRSIHRNLIDQCLEAARIAPSASNSQPWHYYVVENEEKIRQIGDATLLRPSKMNRFVGTAPVLVVLVTDRPGLTVTAASRIKRLDYPLIDVGISVSHFCLQAAELGLGTCMIGWFNSRRIRKTLEISARSRVALVVTLGYPAEDTHEPSQKRRKPIDTIASYVK